MAEFEPRRDPHPGTLSPKLHQQFPAFLFPDSHLKWRAITDPTVQTAAYLTIIAIEVLTCLAILAAMCVMATKLRANRVEFQYARAPLAVGVILSFGLWFIGFKAIGAAWFAMWQSKTWNGQEAAFRFDMSILAVAVYVILDTDGDTDSSH